MSNRQGNIYTLIQNVIRPRNWSEAYRKVIRRGKEAVGLINMDGERSEARAWCAENAIIDTEALERLNISSGIVRVGQMYPSLIEEAQRNTKDCPANIAGATNIDLLFTLCEAIGATKVIETGVAYGWSSLAILLSLKGRADSQLISVDLPYMRWKGEGYIGSVVPSHLRDNWLLFKMADRQGILKAIHMAGSIDLAHYDSDKSIDGKRYAYPLLWKALRPGGVFVSDDISDDNVFREFSRQVGTEPYVIGYDNKYLGILVKS